MANDVVDTKPDVPSVTPKDGWNTSQGQMTAIFTLVCIILSFVGFHYTPEQFQGWVDRAEAMAAIIVPLLAAVAPLMSYITSRGKIASNALMANAQIKVAALTPAPQVGQLTTFADGLTPILGGDSWKDPQRYENLIHVATAVGVPGMDKVNKIDQQIHPADLITSILGLMHHKQKAQH